MNTNLSRISRMNVMTKSAIAAAIVTGALSATIASANPHRGNGFGQVRGPRIGNSPIASVIAPPPPGRPGRGNGNGDGRGNGNGRGRRDGRWNGRGRLATPPPANLDADETDVAILTSQAINGLGCDRAGEVLRRVSNALLANVRVATGPEVPGNPNEVRNRARQEMRRRWRGHMQNPRFWQKVWTRLAEAYRGCELECFDDGVAIGQISGAGYCAASVGVGGLNGIGGVAFQAPLPLCQNATFTGCQVGYDQAAGTFEGCSTYTSGGYTSIFNEFKSQDCHIDQE